MLSQQSGSHRLGIGDILDGAWEVVCRRPLDFLGVGLLSVATGQWPALARLHGLDTGTPLVAAGALLFGVLLSGYWTMAAAWLTERTVLGERRHLPRALAVSFATTPRYLPAMLLVLVILLGLSLLLFVPGIIQAVYYTFVTQVIVLRQGHGKSALDHSQGAGPAPVVAGVRHQPAALPALPAGEPARRPAAADRSRSRRGRPAGGRLHRFLAGRPDPAVPRPRLAALTAAAQGDHLDPARPAGRAEEHPRPGRRPAGPRHRHRPRHAAAGHADHRRRPARPAPGRARQPRLAGGRLLLGRHARAPDGRARTRGRARCRRATASAP